MVKLLALLLWFASSLLGPYVFAKEEATEKQFLTNEQLRDAEFVATWLKTKATNVNKKEAARFLETAMAAKNSSAAAKGFLESMIRYPSPQALAGYAAAESRMFGEIRKRNKNVDQHIISDMGRALDYYKSAIAANAVLKIMPEHEIEQVRKNVACLTIYLQAKTPQKNCQPLQNYAAMR